MLLIFMNLLVIEDSDTMGVMRGTKTIQVWSADTAMWNTQTFKTSVVRNTLYLKKKVKDIYIGESRLGSLQSSTSICVCKLQE